MCFGCGGCSPLGTPTPSALALLNADGELGARRTRVKMHAPRTPAEGFWWSCFIICYLILRKEVKHHNLGLRFSKGSWVKQPRPHSLPPNQAGRNRGGLVGPPGGLSMPSRPHSKPHLSVLQISSRKRPAGDFPGGPVAKTPCSQYRGPGVWSLVRKLDPICPNLRVLMLQLQVSHATIKMEDPACHNKGMV